MNYLVTLMPFVDCLYLFICILYFLYFFHFFFFLLWVQHRVFTSNIENGTVKYFHSMNRKHIINDTQDYDHYVEYRFIFGSVVYGKRLISH